jgi:hypothetical protein
VDAHELAELAQRGRRAARIHPGVTQRGVAGACTDEVYAAMDWLVDRQDGIEK